jgi:hypothetical protein
MNKQSYISRGRFYSTILVSMLLCAPFVDAKEHMPTNKSFAEKLMAAKTQDELAKLEEEENNRLVSVMACGREVDLNRLPYNCFLWAKLSPQDLKDKTDLLADLCISAAEKNTNIEDRDLTILPSECRLAVERRNKILKYKEYR